MRYYQIKAKNNMNKVMLFLVFLSSVLSAQKPIVGVAKVNEVVVYFSQAELSHTISAQFPAGSSTIIVRNIANNLNENSLQISVPPGLTILSAQYLNDQVLNSDALDATPEIKKIRDSIEIVQKEIQKTQSIRSTELKSLEVLDANKVVSGSQTGLNVAELMKLMDYYKLKRTEIENILATLSDKEKTLTKNIKRLNDKIADLQNQNDKQSNGRLMLDVMSNTAGNYQLGVRYLANNAGWSPAYDIKARNVTLPLDLVYKAMVFQNTGIDWKKVKLSLSSGMPSQNNLAPILSAWHLRFGNTFYRTDGNQKMNMIQAAPASEIAIKGSRDDAGNIGDYTQINENQLNISFDIDIPYDISSNGKMHSVALKEISIPAKYKYYSVPKMDQEAYLLAEIEDYSKYNLLRGEANIIFEDMYTGKTVIDPNQINEFLNINLGRDRKLNIKREKISDKSGTKFFSGSKIQTFTYEITVRNNKKDKIDLILKDQYPLSTDKEIEIELIQSDGAGINSETGILTWQLNMVPNETKKFRVSYSVKYPKDKQIENL